jgi:hypothetical protein
VTGGVVLRSSHYTDRVRTHTGNSRARRFAAARHSESCARKGWALFCARFSGRHAELMITDSISHGRSWTNEQAKAFTPSQSFNFASPSSNVIRSATRPLLPVAADRLFRRLGRRARDCVACGRSVGAAGFPGRRPGRRPTGPFDDFADSAPDRARDASGGLYVGAAVPRGRRVGQRNKRLVSTPRRW